MKILRGKELWTDVGFAADVAHLGSTPTRHLVAAVDLGEGGFTSVTRSHFRFRHLLLTNHTK